MIKKSTGNNGNMRTKMILKLAQKAHMPSRKIVADSITKDKT